MQTPDPSASALGGLLEAAASALLLPSLPGREGISLSSGRGSRATGHRALGFLAGSSPSHAGLRGLGSSWTRMSAWDPMGKATSPPHSRGRPPILFSFRGTLPSPEEEHQPLLQTLRTRGWSLRPSPPPPLLVDSQRHRVTEEEVRQNRFQMPPLEEGESGWGGRWRGSCEPRLQT